MHKKFLGNVIRVQLLLLAMFSMQCSLLYGMLSEERRVFKGSDKKRIEEFIVQKNSLDRVLSLDRVWNKDSSACVCITIEKKPSVVDAKHLHLSMVSLNKNKDDIDITTDIFNGYKHQAVGNKLHLFFDEKGGVFCHGIGDMRDAYGVNYQNSLVEYSMDCDGETRIKKCQIVDGKEDIRFSFSQLLHFPELVQAFLNSTRTYDDPIFGFGITIKEYRVSGVIIPDNYKDYRKHPLGRSEVLSYDDLGDCIRTTIENRRAEQQREKNNKILQEK